MKLNNKRAIKNNGKKGSPILWASSPLVVWALIITVLLNYFFSFASTANTVEVKFSEFVSWSRKTRWKKSSWKTASIHSPLKKDAQQGWLTEYYADDKKVDPKTASMPTLYTVPLSYDRLAQLLDAHDVAYYAKTESAVSSFLFSYILPMAIMLLAMIFIFRMLGSKMGGGIGSVGKSNAKMYVEKSTGVTFRDVAGQDEAKESLEEIIDFLHNPEKYTAIGAKLPRGPAGGQPGHRQNPAGQGRGRGGTGAVLLHLRFRLRGDVRGLGASRVRDLFKEASKMAPCIIFYRRDRHHRQEPRQPHGRQRRTGTDLNQLLAELDGFDPSKGVIVPGATNRPEVLDKALLRPYSV